MRTLQNTLDDFIAVLLPIVGVCSCLLEMALIFCFQGKQPVTCFSPLHRPALTCFIRDYHKLSITEAGRYGLTSGVGFAFFAYSASGTWSDGSN